MRRIRVFTVLLVAILGGQTWAQAGFVAYSEGLVEAHGPSGWAEVYVGDSLDLPTTIRLDADGFLELAVGQQVLRYSGPGEYLAEADATSPVQRSAVGLAGGAVSRLLQRSSTNSQDAVTAGVRASDAATDRGFDWSGDESTDEMISDGLAALEQGELDEAAFLFEEAYAFAEGAGFEEAGFLLVYTLAGLQDDTFAIEIIGELDMQERTDLLPDYAVLAAEILVRNGMPGDAYERLIEARDTHPDLADRAPLTAQALHFFIGESSPDAAEAAASYARAAELLPDTALGQAAAAAR